MKPHTINLKLVTVLAHSRQGFAELAVGSGMRPADGMPVAATIITLLGGERIYAEEKHLEAVRAAMHDGKSAIDLDGRVVGPVARPQAKSITELFGKPGTT